MHDEPFAATFLTRIITGARGLVQGYSSWTFSDIFSENYFPSVPFHGGFGLLNLHGIAKPAYRAFQLLHGLGTELLEQLETASALRKEAQPWTHEPEHIDLAVALPPQSVAAITIEFV